MKQEKIIGITFASLGAALTVLCGILHLKADRTAPVIGFQAVDTIYKEGMEDAEILEGAEAYDSVDGDVTERIVIEKIIEDRESGQAVVFYAVSDAAGNVAKASRVFEAVFDEADKETGRAAEGFMEAGITAELGSLQKDSDDKEHSGAEEESGQEDSAGAEAGAGQEDNTGAEDSAGQENGAGTEDSSRQENDAGTEDSARRENGDGTEDSAGQENDAGAEDSARQENDTRESDSTRRDGRNGRNGDEGQGENSREESSSERERESAQVRETSPAPSPAPVQQTADGGGSSSPTLALKVSEVRVKAGQGPAWVDIISILQDDKDNYETLFKNLNVDRYDRNKPGTYQVGVRTEDSDGNSSGTVPLTIIVE